jgi:hypothetical protein
LKKDLNELFKLQWIKKITDRDKDFVNALDPVEDLETLNKKNEEPWLYSEFKVILAGIKLRKLKNAINATVYIPSNPLVAYERNHRKLLERGNGFFHPMKEELEKFISDPTHLEVPPFLARFSAGGNLTILRTPTLISYLQNKENGTPFDFEEYIIINQRDNHPKNLYKNFLALASGIAEQKSDWVNPRLVIACESVEEIIITLKNEDIRIQPEFETFDKEALESRAEDIAERREIWMTYFEEEFGDEKPARPIQTRTDPYHCPTEIISIGDDYLEIHELENGKTHNYHGKIVVDPEIGALDLMTAVRYNIPFPMSMLRLTDGEGTKDDHTEIPKMLWRNIYAFKKEEFKKLFEGEESMADFFFGRNYDDKGNYLKVKWYDGEPVKLTKKPPMVPPLVGAGLALLETIYGYKITPYSQQNPKVKVPTLTFESK